MHKNFTELPLSAKVFYYWHSLYELHFHLAHELLSYMLCNWKEFSKVWYQIVLWLGSSSRICTKELCFENHSLIHITNDYWYFQYFRFMVLYLTFHFPLWKCHDNIWHISKRFWPPWVCPKWFFSRMYIMYQQLKKFHRCRFQYEMESQNVKKMNWRNLVWNKILFWLALE